MRLARHIAILALAALIAAPALATEVAPAPAHEPTQTPPRIRQSQGQGQGQGQSQAADASAWQNQSATNAQGVSTANDSRYYVIPGAAPVTAAPIPAGLCLEGDSDTIDWSVIVLRWAHANSSTRINMKCLEMVLAARAAAAPQPMQLSDARLAHPIPSDQVIALQPEQQLATPPTKPRKKRPSTVAGKTVTVPKCGPSETLACVVEWR